MPPRATVSITVHVLVFPNEVTNATRWLLATVQVPREVLLAWFNSWCPFFTEWPLRRDNAVPDFSMQWVTDHLNSLKGLQFLLQSLATPQQKKFLTLIPLNALVEQLFFTLLKSSQGCPIQFLQTVPTKLYKTSYIVLQHKASLISRNHTKTSYIYSWSFPCIKQLPVSDSVGSINWF